MLAVGASEDFFVSPIINLFSLFSLSLSGRRLDIDLKTA